MRIEIKTNGRVKDKDIKALYLLQRAMEISSERMKEANLKFVLEKHGFQVLNSNRVHTHTEQSEV